MSGVVMDEMLWCQHCRAVKPHTTEWDSEDSKRVYAQCEHHGPRMVSYVEPAVVRQIRGLTYQFA